MIFLSLWQKAKPSTLQELCFYLELIRFLHHGRGLSREPYNDYSLQFVIYLLSFRSSLSFWSTSHWPANSSMITVSLSNLHVKGLGSWWITQKIQVCLVWLPWWLRHGAMDPLEGTFLKVNVDWSDYRIDTFNLVIRLSKVEQSAFPFVCLFVQSCGSRCPLWTFGIFISSRLQPCRTTTNLFFRCSSSIWSATWHERQKATGMSLSCRCGWTYCASNTMEFEQRFMPTWLDLTTFPVGSNARLFRKGLSPFNLI